MMIVEVIIMRMHMPLAGCLIVLLTTGATGVRAESWRRPLQGGLIGGALGTLVSRSSDIDSRVAIPAFAATGALIGYGREQGWFDRSRGDYYVTYGQPYYAYAHRPHPYAYRSHSYAYGSGYGPVYRRTAPQRYRGMAPVATARHHDAREPSRREPALPPVDRQPGVAVEHVAVALPNGVTVNVRLVKLHDRYVGPRGETYAERPSPDTLLRRIQGRD